MKIGPILMSPEMVLANLSGIKIETRRVIKQPNEMNASMASTVAPYCTNDPRQGLAYYWKDNGTWNSSNPIPKIHSASDKLYVREAWRTFKSADELAPRDLKPGHIYMTEADKFVHLVDPDTPLKKTLIGSFNDCQGKFRQGMHMPRWASRMYLEVEEVKIERLHKITPAGCLREGFPDRGKYSDEEYLHAAAMIWYRELWDSLNEERGFGWETNPWVSVTKYKVHMGNIDKVAA